MIVLPNYTLPKCGSIHPLDEQSLDHRDIDARGLIKLWEPPKARARYVIGVDPSAGITNWSRQHRNDDDLKTDNGAIEVIRCGNGINIPDTQVAEYAAPIDAEDLADVVALLGRLYSGNSEYGEALCIVEIWPGPGLLTHRRLVNHYGYMNFFRWEYLESMVPKATNSFGWQSNVKTLQLLWSRFSRHVSKGLLTVRSPWLAEELSDLQNIPGKTFPQPSGELVHDDRVRAVAMGIWAAHDWSLAESIPEAKPIDRDNHAEVNWQASDCSVEDMYEMWERKYQELLNS